MKKERELKAIEMEEIKIVECKNGEYQIFVRCLSENKSMLVVIDTKSNRIAFDINSEISLCN